MDELLRILRSNALESHEAIARMLGMPATQVAERIADYEKRGVIRGYQAILNCGGTGLVLQKRKYFRHRMHSLLVTGGTLRPTKTRHQRIIGIDAGTAEMLEHHRSYCEAIDPCAVVSETRRLSAS